MKIIRETENKLLDRKTIVASTDSGSTITRKDAKIQLAKKIGVSEDLIIIKDIYNKYGDSESIIEAKVYNSKESLEKYARPHLIKRNTFQEESSEEETTKAE